MNLTYEVQRHNLEKAYQALVLASFRVRINLDTLITEHDNVEFPYTEACFLGVISEDPFFADMEPVQVLPVNGYKVLWQRKFWMRTDAELAEDFGNNAATILFAPYGKGANDPFLINSWLNASDNMPTHYELALQRVEYQKLAIGVQEEFIPA